MDDLSSTTAGNNAAEAMPVTVPGTGRKSAAVRAGKGAQARAKTAHQNPAGKKAPAKGKSRACAPEKSFHHGDLKAALIREASRLIAERGEADFSLRELAELIGVTHPAVYRHFRAKADLLADIALSGFEVLAERLARESNPARKPAVYVQFAREMPGTYRAMFHPALRDKGLFPLVQERMDELLAAFDGLSPSVVKWAAAHGLAMLELDGRLPDGGAAAEQAMACFEISASAKQKTVRPKKIEKPVETEPVAEGTSGGLFSMEELPVVRPARAQKKKPAMDDGPTLFDLFA